MIRVKSINFRDAGSMLRRMLESNISFCLFVVVASVGLFFGWRYLDHHSQVLKQAKAQAATVAAARAAARAANPTPVTSSPEIPAPVVATAPPSNPPPVAEVTANPPPETNNHISSAPMPSVPVSPANDQSIASTPTPKAEDKPPQPKTNTMVAEKNSQVSFADSLMSAISPSAKASMVQPQMLPTPKKAKRVLTAKTASLEVHSTDKPMTDEEKRSKVAQDGFTEIMAFAKNYRDIYGFKSNEDLETAKLGDPIRVNVLSQPSRAPYQGQPIKSLLRPADEWFFPIVLNERVRYMVLVQREGQEYVLGHGSRSVAMAYEKIQARWPASEGYHPQLILLPNTPFYYFNVPELPFENITDTSRMLDINPEISPASVQLGSWR